MHELRNHKIEYKVITNAISDIDECTDGSDPCHLNTTTCDNTPGSYRCICKQGYDQNNGHKCAGNIQSV